MDWRLLEDASNGNLESLRDLYRQFERRGIKGSLPAFLREQIQKAIYTEENGFREACQTGDLDFVLTFVSKETNVTDGLKIAASEGHLEIVKVLIEEHQADFLAVDCYPLRKAALGGHVETARYLLEKGSCIDAFRGYPLRMAAAGNHVEMVKLLLEKEANPWLLDLYRVLQPCRGLIQRVRDKIPGLT